MTTQVQKLVPRLGLGGVVVFGVSYMTPTVVVATFGVIAMLSMGASPMAYAVATGAMVLTALSYAKLARQYPSSGSVYTYARRTIGTRFGFIAGWIILLDYLFLPMVAWLIGATLMHAQMPIVPVWGWGLITIGFTTVVNIFGLKVADRVNKTLLVVVLGGIFAVIGFGIAFASDTGHSITAAFLPETTSISAITAGAAVAAYSFLGFDAVSTLSEEVKDPKKNVPRGIILVVLVGGAIFTAASFAMQWAQPNLAVTDPDTGGFDVLVLIGGPVFAGIVNTMLIIGGLASCIAVQATGSRLLFVMGRDGVFPRKTFGSLNDRFMTPVFNIILIAVVGVAGLFLTMGDATSLINFGAFLAFTIANICVIVLWYKNRKSMSLGKHILGFIIIPILGAAVDIYLLLHLSPLALTIGGAWLLAGLIYLGFLTRGFRKPAPGLNVENPTETVNQIVHA